MSVPLVLGSEEVFESVTELEARSGCSENDILRKGRSVSCRYRQIIPDFGADVALHAKGFNDCGLVKPDMIGVE